MWVTVIETFLFLCSFVVICSFIREPLPNRDERSSVSTIKTVLSWCSTHYANTAVKGCHARYAERDTCCVEECGTYERMNVGALKL